LEIFITFANDIVAIYWLDNGTHQYGRLLPLATLATVESEIKTEMIIFPASQSNHSTHRKDKKRKRKKKTIHKLINKLLQ
jgi:hypothetical protein